MRSAERNYYDSKFLEYKNDLCKSWKVIKQVINRRKVSPISSKFNIGNKIVSDKAKIAESFNKFYVDIGPSLAGKSQRQMSTQYHTYIMMYPDVFMWSQ